MSHRIPLIAAGAVLGLGGAAAAVGGGGILAVAGTDGTLSTGGNVTSTTAALVTEAADISGDETRTLGNPTVTVSAQGSTKPVFIGVGPTAAVDRYLAGAATETVTDVDVNPLRLTTTRRGGDDTLPPPGAETFWVERATGASAAETTWKIRDGSYRVVVMNADGSSGVRVRASAAVEVPHLTAVGAGLLGTGLGTLLLGSLLLVAGLRSTSAVEPFRGDLPVSDPEKTPVG